MEKSSISHESCAHEGHDGCVVPCELLKVIDIDAFPRHRPNREEEVLAMNDAGCQVQSLRVALVGVSGGCVDVEMTWGKC